ncbi:transposase [Corynebacterium terpenotabidum]|uniref:Transposase for insertion sequence element n=1 Tax=Corynebacterium terpenotabidum Y-11 TaxID=1200352 RepID=S4XB86_9CORY|nr:transposase [Corynebacterium terpenotabidum]AGP29729.1 transposase for insertion sequence element [Corynebacterium terpenotabidum Y-11]
MPSKYTPELKTRAIELVLHAQADPDTARGAVSRIADELNLSRETLRIWVTQTQGIRRVHADRVGGLGSRKPQAA